MQRYLKILSIVVMYFTLQAFTTTQESYVYICVTGKVYHSTRLCRGLSNATHEIKKVTKEYAIQKHRRACKICY